MYTGSLKPASNRATWVEQFEIYDDETNEPIDLSGALIVVQIRRPDSSYCYLDAAISIAATGVFEASLTRDQMATLCAGQYEIGITITRDDIVIQEFIGGFPVVDGIVRK